MSVAASDKQSVHEEHIALSRETKTLLFLGVVILGLDLEL